MLEDWLVLQLQQAGIIDTVIVQHGRPLSPPHYAVQLRNDLNETFPARWAGKVLHIHLLPLCGLQEVLLP